LIPVLRAPQRVLAEAPAYARPCAAPNADRSELLGGAEH
jgi:hypothetical protein